ncbi:hypothetical protein McanMca71_004741 [Microsporum canis]|uniref:Uncharacterized protein n=1 Tax=Arthroderma otae (strain ATCC MYA-4605 / CBS 113480) TaxID=554155 RepID=C5FF54_ARTOC|nr:conserved hypothetical protein [Microsporum canis CBS 113480]EEQ28438.1 conserved hypothetical protein [Microsporum canis CBS 113480]
MGKSAATLDAGANPPSTQAAADGPRNFEFVLVTDSESRRQVRRHAMRQYVHQRRLDGIARLESTRVQVTGWSTGKTPSTASASPKVEELENDDEPKAPCRARSLIQRRASQRAAAAAGHKLGRSATASPPASSTEWRPVDPKAESPLVAYEPFNCLPLVSKEVDNELIDHYVTKYPMMMYKMENVQQDNPIRAIFHNIALHDPVPFQAMLAVAAKHRAGMEGQVETVQSLTHKMRALKLIKERLKNDDIDKEDGTLYAVASLTVIEKWSKDSVVERTHFQGIKQLIRRRGGMQAMRTRSPTGPFLEKVVYWVDFSCASNAIVGAGLPWTGEIPDIPPKNISFVAPEVIPVIPTEIPANEDPDDIPDILQACEDFLSFFRSLDDLECAFLYNQPLPPLRLANDGLGRPPKPFEETSPLYTLLANLPDYDHGIRDVRFIDEYTCMACLLYLNFALHDCYLNHKNFDDYLNWVNQAIRGVNPRSSPSIASLLWIFLNNGGFQYDEKSDSGERSWLVSRMLRVAKRLEWEQHGRLWDKLRSTLFQFLLTQSQCGLGRPFIDETELNARKERLSRGRQFIWDEDEMRQNILGNLYTGPPLFGQPPISVTLSHNYSQGTVVTNTTTGL